METIVDPCADCRESPRGSMPQAISYAMSKGALDVLTSTPAKQLGPRAITDSRWMTGHWLDASGGTLL